MIDRFIFVPWGLRHLLRWTLTFGAWIGNRCRPLPFDNGIEAITPGAFTLLLTKTPSLDLLVHEGYHQARCRWLGLLPYWRLMVGQILKYGYANAPEEIAARKHAGQE